MKDIKRHAVQAVAAFVNNGYLSGFLKGRIWQGTTKRVCVPGLNCYSCPGALGACPIGSLQAVLSGSTRGVSYYVTGIILLYGIVLGRLVCGFLCPFGFIQDLLFKIKLKKMRVPDKIDRPMRKIKYIALTVFVIALPLFAKSEFGAGIPWFCKFICPAGTLEGGLPLLAANESLRAAAGALFSWKLLVLAGVVITAVFIYRSFCKYLCPLGAIYGLLNRWSFYGMRVDKTKCIDCGACENACNMNVEVRKNINSPECIRCGACKSVCPRGAIGAGFANIMRSERRRSKRV